MTFAALDAQILSALKSGEALTPAIAAERWRCLALHSAIARLRERGHSISCVMVSANGRRYGTYRLNVAPQGSVRGVEHAGADGPARSLGYPASATPDTLVTDAKGKPLYYATGYGPGWPPGQDAQRRA